MRASAARTARWVRYRNTVGVGHGNPVEEGHAIAHQGEEARRLKDGQITDGVVHLEPAGGVAAARRGEVDYREQRSPQEAP